MEYITHDFTEKGLEGLQLKSSSQEAFDTALTSIVYAYDFAYEKCQDVHDFRDKIILVLQTLLMHGWMDSVFIYDNEKDINPENEIFKKTPQDILYKKYYNYFSEFEATFKPSLETLKYIDEKIKHGFIFKGVEVKAMYSPNNSEEIAVNLLGEDDFESLYLIFEKETLDNLLKHAGIDLAA